MRRSDALIIAAAAVLLSASAAGMVVSAPVRETPDRPLPSLPAIPGPSVIREGLVGSVQGLDPLMATTQAERDIGALLFRGLTRVTPDGAIEPDVADRWTVEDGGRAYRFELRRDVHWHDGRPVTADDVLATIATLQDPAYTLPRGADWRDVSVQRLDRFAVRFELPEPLAAFLGATTVPLVPAHLVKGVPISERVTAAFARTPVGSGPFSTRSFTATEVVLGRVGAPLGGGAPSPAADPLAPLPESTPRRAPQPRAQVDGYVFRLFAHPTDAAWAFEAGQLDILSGRPPLVDDPLQAQARTIDHGQGLLATVMPNVRFERSIMRDPLVRRALSVAIDRAAIVRDVLDGAGKAVQSPIRPGSFAFDPLVSRPPVHDPDAARVLLATAGWTPVAAGWTRPRGAGAAQLELLTLDDPDGSSDEIAERVARDWRAIGLEVDVRALGTAELADRLRAADFDAAVLDVRLGLDPDLYPLLISHGSAPGGSNIPGYQSSVLDDLLRSTRLQAPETARREAFSLLQALFVRELPFLPICFQDHRSVVRAEVVGPAPRELAVPEDRYGDVLTWTVATEPNG